MTKSASKQREHEIGYAEEGKNLFSKDEDGGASVRPFSAEPSSVQAFTNHVQEDTEASARLRSYGSTVKPSPVKKSNIVAEFRRKCREDAVYSENLKHSLCLALALFAVGVTESQGGPTFLDLQIITDTDVGQASAFFTSHSCGSLLGSLISGYISERKVNASFTLLLSLLAMGVGVISMPYCVIFETMVAMQGLTGVCGGFISTTATAEQMRIWGKEGHVLMQLLHFCFALGGVVSPLVTEPFLAAKKNGETSGHSANLSTHAGSSSHGDYDLRDSLSRVVGLSAFYVLYCSVEDTFASFLMTFVVRRFKTVSKSDGAHITAVYWSSFAASRFLMIFVSRVLSPVRVLYVGGSLMLLSFTGFTFSSGPWVGEGSGSTAHAMYINASSGISGVTETIKDIGAYAAGEDGGSVPILTVFTAMAGLAMSGVFPASVSWNGAELLKVTGRISSCIFISASLGAMLNPLLVSRLMQDVSNMWFCYVLLLEVSGLTLIFWSLLAFNRCYLNRRYGKLHGDGVNATDTFGEA
ncbi:sodium-dependent glucose transporter 1 [Elysia marginata]|uniref:Sodium-dependent glucose transporter 1 n=1 Tax=Elysia marginata TaxID=1093978 RepID=A0AAV4JP90_9GAST|nr:sodium-dependent glucose transporter 1 [Elysia marginata]